METTSSHTAGYVRELLGLVDHPQAGTIKVRRSNTRREAYLSHGCPGCDALFGAFPLEDHVAEVLMNRGLAGLQVVAEIQRPVVEWWAVLCDRDNLWWP